MQKSIFGLLLVAVVTGGFLFGSVDTQAQDSGSNASQESLIAEGRDLSFERKKGNCLACHIMGDGQLPGNIGPPLIAIKSRFPDKSEAA